MRVRKRGSPEGFHHPQAALLHPLWLAALALLVLNDQWFKASGAMPMLTGKLSDFSGLLVAPLLMATVLRARRWRSIIACHVAVGVVFTGLQLVPEFSRLWSQMIGVIGVGWTTWSDPTDLIALPMLWVSAHFLGRPSRRRPGLSALQVALAGIGLVCCMGTSGGYPRCESDDHCADKNEYCLNGYCNECAAHEHCDGGRECQAGQCGFPVGYCDANIKCPSGYACTAKTCEAVESLP